MITATKSEAPRGGAASLRIDDPNPDIEFVETGLTGPDPGAVKPDAGCVRILHRHSGLQITLHVDQLLLTEAPR